MALSDIVTVSISTDSAQVERAGFGIPLILAADAPVGFTERVRTYTDLAGVLVDFATTTTTYKMATAVFAQDPKPTSLMVGRLALKPTQHWTYTPVAANSTVYTITVDGTAYSITSDASATATEICDALRTALGTPTGLTLGGTATLTFTASAAGAAHSLELGDPALAVLVQDHADPGYATDLAAINNENSSWYVLLNAFNSKACIEAIAAWVESNGKLFIAQTQDSQVVTLASGSDTSTTVAATLHSSSYFRTALIYHGKTAAYADAAWAGAVLPLDPGSETWAFKTLTGPAFSVLTATQRANAIAKFCNVYERDNGVSITSNGKVSGNEWIDVIRFRDWLATNMAADVFQALVNAAKIPMTDAGIAVIQGIVKARLQLGVDVGGLSSSPAPVVTVPLASAISAANKAARTLTPVRWDATLAGAIQVVTISGRVSV